MDRKIFGTLFFSIFAAVTGVGIVVPLLPVYAHDLGASGIYIGLIFGSFSLSRTVFIPYFGSRSDLRGRKPFIVIGLLSYALVSVGFMLVDAVGPIIVLRFFQGIASAMMMPVIQAYVGDITPPGKEGTVMGLFNLSMFMGLSFGPLMGGFIKDRFSLDAAFMAMGILSLGGFALSLVLLPPRNTERVVKKGAVAIDWRRLLADKGILSLVFFRIAYTAGIGIIWGFLPVLADTELGLSGSTIGFLIMLGVFVSGVLQVPMGVLADRASKTLLLVCGGLVVAVAISSYRYSQSLTGLLLGSIGFGFGGGIAMPSLMAVAVVKGNRLGAMGSVMGLITMAHSFGMLGGSLLAGILMDFYNLRLSFTAGAALMLMAVVFVFLCRHELDIKGPVPSLDKSPIDPIG
ncbi:MAG: MFS transporter [Desulfobacterales bacterium]|nr:MFS transporter [Desulfobacterales bacterium]